MQHYTKNAQVIGYFFEQAMHDELLADGWRAITVEEAKTLTAPPAPEAPAVPKSVTMRQAREALIDAGLIDQIDLAIASIPGVAGQKARNYWERSNTVERATPLVGLLATTLGLTDAQLDTLFIAAAKL